MSLTRPSHWLGRRPVLAICFIHLLAWLPCSGLLLWQVSWLLIEPALLTVMRLPSVSDTDRAPMRGLPLPNCLSHWLTSYTLLPQLPSAAATSAVPYWNLLPLRCLNLCGRVGVALPFRNKGKSGTLPSIRLQGPTVWLDCFIITSSTPKSIKVHQLSFPCLSQKKIEEALEEVKVVKLWFSLCPFPQVPGCDSCVGPETWQ